MNKERVTAKLRETMIERAKDKLKSGERDFPAYPWLGKLAVGLVVGLGEKSDSFYAEVNQAIVEASDSQIYAISTDTGSGFSDGRNHVRGNLAPIDARTDQIVKIRARSPRTQSE